jgi:hypothetical protein
MRIKCYLDLKNNIKAFQNKSDVPNSVLGDSINKPYKAIPLKQLTAEQAEHLSLFLRWLVSPRILYLDLCSYNHKSIYLVRFVMRRNTTLALV